MKAGGIVGEIGGAIIVVVPGVGASREGGIPTLGLPCARMASTTTETAPSTSTAAPPRTEELLRPTRIPSA
jgi:hypothetical protein